MPIIDCKWFQRGGRSCLVPRIIVIGGAGKIKFRNKSGSGLAYLPYLPRHKSLPLLRLPTTTQQVKLADTGHETEAWTWVVGGKKEDGGVASQPWARFPWP